MKDPAGSRRFTTTQWSLVYAARDDKASQARAREALETLCRTYWYPLYAFVRSRGYSAADAQDLTQAFFARTIEKQGLTGADRDRGRFRSYLLGAMKHFLANEWHRLKTHKRGGSVSFVEWDVPEVEARYAGLPKRWDDPDYVFDREWALETVAAALQALRDEMTKAGKAGQFELLKNCLTGEGETPREELAERLEMSASALKVAIHRLRQRYRKLLRTVIGETVSSELELDDEMRYLVTVLRKTP